MMIGIGCIVCIVCNMHDDDTEIWYDVFPCNNEAHFQRSGSWSHVDDHLSWMAIKCRFPPWPSHPSCTGLDSSWGGLILIHHFCQLEMMTNKWLMFVSSCFGWHRPHQVGRHLMGFSELMMTNMRWTPSTTTRRAKRYLRVCLHFETENPTCKWYVRKASLLHV